MYERITRVVLAKNLAGLMRVPHFVVSDVPRRLWSCCMLGKLAGEKGFHCNVAFYASSINKRNANRPHNSKLLLHNKRHRGWGWNLMNMFERCVEHHAKEFHKCCYASAIEKRERIKWRYYRAHGAGATEAVSPHEPANQRPRKVPYFVPGVQVEGVKHDLFEIPTVRNRGQRRSKKKNRDRKDRKRRYRKNRRQRQRIGIVN